MERYRNYYIKTSSGKYLSYKDTNPGTELGLSQVPNELCLFKFITLMTCNTDTVGIKMGERDTVLELTFDKQRKGRFSFSVNDANYKKNCCFTLDIKKDGKYSISQDGLFLSETNGIILFEKNESLFELIPVKIDFVPGKIQADTISRLFSNKPYILKIKNMDLFLGIDENSNLILTDKLDRTNKNTQFELKELKQSFIQSLKLYSIKCVSNQKYLNSKLKVLADSIDFNTIDDLFAISHANFSSNTFWIENNGRSLMGSKDKRVQWSGEDSDPQDPFVLFEFIEASTEHFENIVLDQSKKYSIKLSGSDKFVSLEKDTAVMKTEKQVFQILPINDKVYAINIINTDKFLNYDKEIITSGSMTIDKIKTDTNYENYTFIFTPTENPNVFVINDNSEESSLKVMENGSLSMNFKDFDTFEFVDETGKQASTNYFDENVEYIIKSSRNDICFSAQNDDTLRLFGNERESRYCFPENRFKMVKWGEYWKIKSIKSGKWVSAGTFIHDMPQVNIKYPVGMFIKDTNKERDAKNEGDIIYNSIFDIQKLQNGNFNIIDIPSQKICVNFPSNEQDQVRNDNCEMSEFQIIPLDYPENFESIPVDKKFSKLSLILIALLFIIVLIVIFVFQFFS